MKTAHRKDAQSIPEPASRAASLAPARLNALVGFRKYQERVFWDMTTKTAILHWSRQIGKSYTLAAWAVKRLLDRPGRLVTVLSNSRDNGAEFVIKAQEICRKLGQALEIESNADELNARGDLSEDVKYELMRFEIRLTVNGQLGRIKVLAANPRTARGFSGDLILDEFAFHENSAAIWEAAEPIISSNPDFLCRISSTGNGRQNMFYQLISEGRIPYYRVRRSDAWATGELKIYSVIDGHEITPEEARAQASDKRAYDQNYECAFNDEQSALLTADLINAAQRDEVVIEKQAWSEGTISRLAQSPHPLYFGLDVGRKIDLSVLAVGEKMGSRTRVAAMLEMQNLRGPAQLAEIGRIATLPGFRGGEIDMTGLGTFLVDFTQEKYGMRCRGVNFSSTEPVSNRLRAEGRKGETAKVTELMATDLLGVFEDRAIEIPMDAALRDDLRKPERLVSPSGKVSIAAVRDEGGHADRFWALALLIRALRHSGAWACETVKPGTRTASGEDAFYESTYGSEPPARRERTRGLLV